MTERILPNGQELFHEAFERLPLGVLIVDAQGTIVTLNEELERLLGYSRNELIGQSVEKLIPERLGSTHRQARLEYARHARTRPMGAGRELYARHRNGQSVPVEIGLSPITVGNEQFVLSTIVDITERRRLEQQLSQTQKLEAIGNLASGIAHDFNNVLLGILGYAELLKMAKPGDPDSKDNLDVIIEAAIRGRSLVERILTFGRKGQINRHPTHWEPVIQETLKLLRVSIPPNIGIHTQFEANAPVVLADPIELQQIFMNLVTNAVHAMASRGGIVRTQVSSVLVDDEFVVEHEIQSGLHTCLSVVDEGAGMSPDVLSHIFDPFFTTKPPGEGTGLGMFVIRGVVTSLGGMISVNSREGQGTRVDVYLPTANGDLRSETGQPPLHGGGPTQRLSL